MNDTMQNDLVTVNIDGHSVKVPKGLNMILAAEHLKKEIPHYCYHPKLPIVGNCRMCLIEMGMPMKDRATGQPILNEDGSPKIGWAPKPAIACTTNAVEGLHIKTDSPLVKDCRNGVMEFLLINHPLDCPICDQAGECALQEFATDYGRGYSRFLEEKNVKPKRTTLGPRVTLDDERCILCSRCIRFMQEIPKDDVLGFIDRGSYSTLTCYPGKVLDSNYSLNTVDICPVGALTSTDFRFKMRVWFLKKTKSICTESSVGVNTYVWSREGKIYRITPRENEAVNDCWMPDSGRELYKLVESENRLHETLVKNQSQDLLKTLESISLQLKQSPTAIVISPHQSVEEMFLIQQIARKCNASVFIAAHVGEGDGILISEDHAPNARAAILLGLISEFPHGNLNALSEKIHNGSIKTLLVYGEDLSRFGISSDQLKNLNLIYLGTHHNNTQSIAQTSVPTLTVFEKSGSFINQQFRLQKFEQAVPGPTGILPDVLLLNKILEYMESNTDHGLGSIDVIWSHLSKEHSIFSDITFKSIPATGVLLDEGSWKHLNIPMSKTLKSQPA